MRPIAETTTIQGVTITRRQAIIELARRKREEKYRYYVPTVKSAAFIELVGTPDIFVAYYSAANGVGKTRCGVNLLAHLIWPCNNEYFRQPLFTDWPFPKNILIVSNHTTVENTIVHELRDQFPRNKYTADKNGRHFDAHFETNNGWTLDIMTYDQALESFESATRGLIWFDEPPPEAIFKACVARLRKGGKIFITATPLNMTAAWLVEKVIERPMDEVQEHGKTAYIEADVESACKTHAEPIVDGVSHGRGFLEHNHILNMIAQYDDADIQARVFGKSRALIGRVIKSWNKKVHLVPAFKITQADYVVAEYVDTHARTPDAVLWVAIDRYGRHFACNELKVDGDDQELAEAIKRVRQLFAYRIVAAKIDPSSFNVDKHTGYSLAAFLSQNGLDYEPASKNRDFNNRMLRQGFKFTHQGGVIVRPPQWYVFDTLEHFPWEIEHWQWDDWRGKAAEYHGEKQTPMDKDDHYIECAARIAGDQISWRPFVQQPAIHRPPQLDPYLSSTGSITDTLDPYA